MRVYGKVFAFLCSVFVSAQSLSYERTSVYDSITLSAYNFYHICGDEVLRDGDIRTTMWEYGYVIVLKSKYNMFKNYSNFSYKSANMVIESELYHISLDASDVEFINRQEVRIYLEPEVIKKLMAGNLFRIYYPSDVFSKSYKESLLKKLPVKYDWDEFGNWLPVDPSSLVADFHLYSDLSTKGFKDVVDDCNRTVEEIRREKSKPLNVLKEFFR